MTCRSSERLEVLRTPEEIHQDVLRLGRSISEFYRGQPLTAVGILNGCIPFLADLCRALDLDDLVLDTLAVSSYRHDRSSGRIEFRCRNKTALAARHVLLVDDVLDTGTTLAALRERLREESPLSVRTCVYAEKALPGGRPGGVRADWTGHVFPDEYLVGYGMDSEERHRGLPWIAARRG